MTHPRPDLIAFLVAALVIVCATVITVVTGARDVPDFFRDVALVAVGAGGGASMQRAPQRAGDTRRAA